MNRQTILGAVLLAQLIIVAVVWGLQSRSGDAPPVFLSFDVQDVDTLTVADADSTVTVARADGEWRLSGGLPADAGKVDGVLQKLADVGAAWPVATSESAMERFEVVEEAHQRHVTLGADEENLADLYLGTSADLRKGACAPRRGRAGLRDHVLELRRRARSNPTGCRSRCFSPRARCDPSRAGPRMPNGRSHPPKRVGPPMAWNSTRTRRIPSSTVFAGSACWTSLMRNYRRNQACG